MGIWDSVKKYGGYALGGLPGAVGAGHIPPPWDWADESPSAIRQREMMERQGERASNFADQGELGYAALSAEGRDSRQMMRDRAMGKDSLSAEQLRQGLQQQQAQFQSMAAGGPAGAQPMNARTAMLASGRASSAMAGNAAMAGIAERQAALDAWQQAILGARGQDAQVALGSRQNAISGYGGYAPDKSFLDKWGNAMVAGAQMGAGAV